MINLLDGNSGKNVDPVIRHHAGQLLVDGDLSDTLNCIEDHSRARTFRDRTIEESLDDSDRQLRLGDTYCIALVRKEQQILQAALEYIQWM